MRGFALAAVATTVAGVLFGTSAATAATVTISGSITSGRDDSGVFGAPDPNLSGKHYTFTGDQSGGTLTINGIGYQLLNDNNLGPAANTPVEEPLQPNYNYLKFTIEDERGLFDASRPPVAHDSTLILSAMFFTGEFPSDNRPFEGVPCGVEGCYMSFRIGTFVKDSHDGYILGDSALGVGTIDQSSGAGFPSFVPEPGEWALMLGGFGMRGAALRRRIRVAKGMVE